MKKEYAWTKGVVLDDHSRRKHKILREYFFQYITVRCRNPQQSMFRLAVVDGFSGGGRYACGEAGSPIIFIEELQRALDAVNVRRAAQGLGAVKIECLLVFNDAVPAATERLKQHCEPLVAAVKSTCPKLRLSAVYLSKGFEETYPAIKELIAGRYRNVIFNLDQCGHAQVDIATLNDIMRSSPSAEIFYTFAINAVLACAALWFINRNLWALAALPVLFLASRVDVRVPRLRWAFYAYYPLHLAALWLIRIPMSKAGYLFF